MALAPTVDLKLSFPQYDCRPGREAYENFEQNLFVHGGASDDLGWSITDCLKREDDGALDAAGNPVPGMPVIPAGGGGGAAVLQRQARRRKRLKESHRFIVAHISNPDFIRALSLAPYLGNGPLALDYIRLRNHTPMDTTDTQDKQQEWLAVTIVKDIGVNENSIMELDARLARLNSELAVGMQFSDDATCEKILREIAKASRTFLESATAELNAAEGVPGQPGVRRFQQAAPMGGGPRPRDKQAMLVYFHQMWRTAVRSKVIPTAAATASKPSSRGTVETGLKVSVDGADMSSVGVEVPTRVGRDISPTRTLSAIADAGFETRRGLITTSDFDVVPRRELAFALTDTETIEADGTGDISFSVEHCFDANDQESVELICRCCLGIGHIGRQCPSVKKTRTYAYGIQMLQNAKARAEANAAAKGGAQGGRRVAARGQQPPFRPTFPRRYQQMSRPARKFLPGREKSMISEEQANADEETAYIAGEEPPRSSVETAGEAKAFERRENLNLAMPTTVQDSTYFLEHGKLGLIKEMEAVDGGSPVEPSPCYELLWEQPDGRGREKTSTGSRGAILLGITVTLLSICLAFVTSLTAAISDGAVFSVRAATRLWDVLCEMPAIPGIFIVLAIVLCGRRTSAMPTAGPCARNIITARPTLSSPYPWYDVLEQAKDVLPTMLEHGWIGEDRDVPWQPSLDDGNEPRPMIIDLDTQVSMTIDSGASAICISEHDEWMLETVTDARPNVGVEIADGVILPTMRIGTVNRQDGTGGRLSLDCWTKRNDKWAKVDKRQYPFLGRVLVVKGLKKGTRLGGVRPLKADGINAYFNADNAAKLTDCLRLKNGVYSLFSNDPRFYEIGFYVEEPTRARALVARDCLRTPMEVHASLMHHCDSVVQASNITIAGFDMSRLVIATSDCAGCRIGKAAAPRHLRSMAPSAGGVRAPYGSKAEFRAPSSTGYMYFGQRIDSDLSVKMPRSWPHGFTGMLDFCDRNTAEIFYYFVVNHTSDEVAGASEEFVQRVKHRLKDGRITRWHVDNDLSFDGPATREFAQELVAHVSNRVPNDSDTNAVAERRLGTGKSHALAALAYAGADPCLWPWAVHQYELIAYFMSTRAHKPPMSPYTFSNAEAGPSNLSWAKPLFCDVTVHLAKRDVHGKLTYSNADGCYFGRDVKRNCEFVYVPSLQRLSSFTVVEWQPNAFTICKGIKSDTPVDYRDPSDLRYGELTGSLLPKRITARGHKAYLQEKEGVNDTSRLQEKEGVHNAPDGLAAAAAAIERGVEMMDRRGVQPFIQETAHSARMEAVREGVQTSVHPMEDFTIRLHGPEHAKAVVASSQVLKVKNIAEARTLPYWQLIREALEAEIAGKLANGFATVVKRTPEMRVMKVKWVIDIALNDDGSVKRVKARLVGCGYSQVEGADYDEIYAHTLPGACFRIWASVVCDEDLETDQIDAIKAFTQAELDRILYSEMPEGFCIPGYVLQLLKALEGIKQGAMLWFKKNKWAWNKCGMHADMAEPNLYTHEHYNIIAAVFADDVGAGFHHSVRQEYLKIRAAYADLINIDSPGPEMIRPVTVFTGCEITRNRQTRVLKITQRTYIAKLKARYNGRYTREELPYGASKSKRDDFDNLVVGTESTPEDRADYLNILGSIGWAAIMTRPEISYTSSRLSSFSQHPTKHHINAGLHVIGYLANTPELGIVYGGALKVPLGLTSMPEWFEESRGYYGTTDSSWGRHVRPYGGHAVFRLNGVIIYSSKGFKTTVPGSTAEAETAQASRATKDLIFGRNVLLGIKRTVKGPSFLLGDNSAMMDIIKKDGTTSRTRYFDRATMLVKFAVMKLLIVTRLVSTKNMIADIFTKAVDQDTFRLMRGWLLNSACDVTDNGYRASLTMFMSDFKSMLARV